MSKSPTRRRPRSEAPVAYRLDEQVGFILRQVSQRHSAIFTGRIGTRLTATQWAALAKLAEAGPCSQNQLGRLTAMDVATIKGVIDRLTARGLTETARDPDDGRRLIVRLTRAGQQTVDNLAAAALGASEETLAPLSARERATFTTLLTKLR
jgi:DNA-binding MarR family transcriptional regulator